MLKAYAGHIGIIPLSRMLNNVNHHKSLYMNNANKTTRKIGRVQMRHLHSILTLFFLEETKIVMKD